MYCSRCEIDQPLDNFPENLNMRNKKDSWCKKCYKEERLESRYGINFKQYNELLSKQNNLCAICKRIPTTKRTTLVVDHNISGKIRGLLCHTCNLMLGHAKDSIVILEEAIKYIAKGEEK